MIQHIAERRPLNDGNAIPGIGFGVYQMEVGNQTEEAVLNALKLGYRHIDTAACYHNETDVGRAIKKSGIPREEIFVTTKLWDSDQGTEEAVKAFHKSLEKLDLDYVDLYLVHSPMPGKEKRLATWKTLEKLQKEGKIKSLGVSNFGIHHLKELMENSTVKPTVNQIEVSPYNTREELVAFCQQNDILVEAYAPLTTGMRLGDPRLKEIADKYNKSPAQVLLRWSLQKGCIPLPKSAHLERIKANADVFDFELSAQDMSTLSGFDEKLCYEWDPTTCD